MTRPDEQYPDIASEHADLHTARLVRDLDALFAVTAPPATRESIARALRHHGRSQHTARRRSRTIWSRLSAAVAAFGLLAGGVLLAVQHQRPAPVSAQEVLRRAATSQPPNSARHLVYRELFPGSVARSDSWAATDARGNPVRSAITVVERTQGTVTSISRSLDEGGVTRGYDYLPQSLVVHKYIMTDAQIAKKAGPLRAPTVQQLLRRPPQHVHLLPQRRLNGVLVYPVHFDAVLREYGQNEPEFTTYFDAHTYILRQVDNPREQFVGTIVPNLRLVKDETVPLSAVPPHTFELHPPEGVLVLP